MTEESTKPKSKLPGSVFKLVTWLLAFGCFYLVYSKVATAAEAQGVSAIDFVWNFISEANWWIWLSVMIPYSFFFFFIDSHVTWRAVRWFNAPDLKLRNILPIRASAYILSLISEQVGKGGMTLYLWKRYEAPGWQVLSTMIFLGLMEIYQLLMFSCFGMLQYYDEIASASTQLPLHIILIGVLIFAVAYLPLHILFFRGYIGKRFNLRNHQYLRAFREAQVKHYALTVLFKAPNLIGAIFVYTTALWLFQVEASFGQMLVFLPLIFLAAALPLPFHAGALLIWTLLFPDYPEVGIFSLIMHTFFVLFNALIGLAFLPKANRELFDTPTTASN